jgi:hypothetical protein
MSPRPDMAQRAARWSAEHRRAAIFGWLALVIPAKALDQKLEVTGR